MARYLRGIAKISDCSLSVVQSVNAAFDPTRVVLITSCALPGLLPALTLGLVFSKLMNPFIMLRNEPVEPSPLMARSSMSLPKALVIRRTRWSSRAAPSMLSSSDSAETSQSRRIFLVVSSTLEKVAPVLVYVETPWLAARITRSPTLIFSNSIVFALIVTLRPSCASVVASQT